MDNRLIEFAMSCKKIITVSHQIRIENGFERDEQFTIVDIIGNYELCMIENQYGQSCKVNPKYLSL